MRKFVGFPITIISSSFEGPDSTPTVALEAVTTRYQRPGLGVRMVQTREGKATSAIKDVPSGMMPGVREA
jgi:hypothetical protein